MCVFVTIAVSAAAESDLLSRINRIRAENDLPFLAPSTPAADAAEGYAQGLAAGMPFSHVDTEGNSADRRYRDAGGTGLVTGEILGKGADLDGIIALWLESPRHRRLLLGTEWTRAGAGTAEGTAEGEGQVYAAVTFVFSLYADLELKTSNDDPPPEVDAGGAAVLIGRYIGKNPPVVISGGKTMIPRVDPAGRFSLPLSGRGTIFVIRLGYYDRDEDEIVVTDMTVLERTEWIGTGGSGNS